MTNPILVQVYREGVLESFHRGVICLVDRDGKIIYSAGDVQQICYPRSALKFFQHMPLLESGAADHFGFTDEEIAVMCGSHNGEAEHLRVVDQILEKIGLDRSFLKCGPQFPSDRKSSNELIRTGEKPQAIHNNCSGKHAGFLAMSVYLGADPESYLSPAHPVQQKVLETSSDFHEYPKESMTIALDGCSAPIFSIPVYHQALAYKNLVAGKWNDYARQKACERIVKAVSEYPFMVAGTHRYCTDLMRECAPEIIGKTGAEGIYSLAFSTRQWGACIKIDDGKMLPQYNVAQKLVEKSGAVSLERWEKLSHYKESPITNFNQWQTGEIRVADDILRELPLP